MLPTNTSVRELMGVADTVALGNELATTIEDKDILLLFGELGAGKTTLAKAMLESLGVTDDTTSPTFTLMNVYRLPNVKNGIHTAVHVDAYRIETESELTDIGLQDYLGQPGTVCLIEWPEKIPNLLQAHKTVSLHLAHTPNGRSATITT